jgi:hypothetical protein
MKSADSSCVFARGRMLSVRHEASATRSRIEVARGVPKSGDRKEENVGCCSAIADARVETGGRCAKRARSTTEPERRSTEAAGRRRALTG